LFTAPGAPVNLQVTEQTAYTTQLQWQHPNITNGRLRKFDITVKLVSSHLRKPKKGVKMPENVSVEQPFPSYSHEVSESWNLHFL
jgi:hypothetical protein